MSEPSWTVEIRLCGLSQPFIRALDYPTERDAITRANYIVANGIVVVEGETQRFIPPHRIHEVVVAPSKEETN